MKVIPDPELRKRSTIRLGGRALAEIWVEKEQDWDDLPELMTKEGASPLVLGKGSNILFLEGKLPLLIIRTSYARELEVVKDKENECIIQVGAWTSMARLVAWLQRQGLTGMEGLTGIPGSVGGAVAMNAGSFGMEMGKALHKVQVWSRDNGLIWLHPEDFRATYRSFEPAVQGFWIITQAQLSLKKKEAKGILLKMRHYLHQKKRSQPIYTWTCGCVFKNPTPEHPAGYLLEKCGFKGYRHGDLSFSQMHANFLINHGRGKSSEALEIIEQAENKVREKFGFDLEMELRVVG